jgi:hypothetical protein
LGQRNDAGLLAVLIDQPDFAPGDLVVEPEFVVCGDVGVLQ